MKRILFCILLLASLTACSGASSGGTHECNKKEGVCIYIKVEEPIRAEEPITVSVKVKADKDISDLWVSLSAPGNLSFEDPGLKTWKKDGIAWKLNAKAKELHTLKTKVRFPIEEGSYHLVVGVGTDEYGRMAFNGVRISISGNEVKVYYSGTPISITAPPLIETIYFYTYTPDSLQTPTLTPTLETTTPSYP